MLDKIKDFMLDKVFDIQDFAVTWWMIIAAAAAILLLLIIIIICATAKKRRAKKQEKKAAKAANNDGEQSNTELVSVDASKKETPIAVEPADEKIEELLKEVEAQPEKAAAEPVTAVKEPVSAPVEEISELDKLLMELDAASDTPAQLVDETEAAAEPATESNESEIAADVVTVNETKAAPKASVKPRAKKISANKSTPIVINMDALPKEVKEKAQAKEKPQPKVQVLGEGDGDARQGKFIITRSMNNITRPYNFCLLANNGQLLFESESYKIKPRANSLEAFKRNCQNGNFVIDDDKNGAFRFKLFSVTGILVGVGESYKSKQACESSIQSVKRFAETASVIEDLTEQGE